MATVTSLHTKDADPLRSELAEAIEHAREAQDAVARQRAAIERTRSSVIAAEKAVKTAEEGVPLAAAAYAQALADAAADETAPPKSGVAAARLAVVDAQDEVEALKGALAQLKADLPGLQESALAEEVEVDSAISAVLLVPARALYERTSTLELELEPLRQALATLLKDRMPEAGDALAHQRGRAPLNEVYAGIMKFGAWRAGGPDLWTVARQRLRENAFAALPDDFAPPPSDAA